MVVLVMIALKIAFEKQTITEDRYIQLLAELHAIPEKVKELLRTSEHIRKLALKYKDVKDALYLGRGNNFPVALEGALKLKEISYIHAEGYPAAEMKHGPIALVDENLPVIFAAPKSFYHEKLVSNIQEIKARKGKVIAVISEGDEVIIKMADDIMTIPLTDELISPLLSVIPLQLFACYMGMAKGFDVDKPRNLAKSVTVE
jgi:glucosamine--fructose-6-phosphate aminotransferase (isomerizing)